MAIILMIIAIIAGQFVGSYLTGMFGSFGAGIIGSLLVGLVTYAIYTLLSRGKFGLFQGIMFSVMVYVANIAAGYVGGMLGLASGYMTLAIAGLIMSFVWGWVGGKGKGRGLKL